MDAIHINCQDRRSSISYVNINTHSPYSGVNPIASIVDTSHGRVQMGGGGEGVRTHPKKSHLGFLGITGSEPLKNRKATKPAVNVGPLSAPQRNAI